ncbi:MAG: hypothetical protein ACRC1K_02270, partial [Planctomycetia bacterium]
CKRLEELLMTPFDMGDYVRASLAASWSRGRWYMASALLLWVVAVSIGRLPAERGLLAAAAGLGMIGLYFALGFRSLAKSADGVRTGFLLTVGLPLLAWALGSSGADWLARWTPPGAVYYALHGPYQPIATIGAALLMGGLTVYTLRAAHGSFMNDLRNWYDVNVGAR